MFRQFNITLSLLSSFHHSGSLLYFLYLIMTLSRHCNSHLRSNKSFPRHLLSLQQVSSRRMSRNRQRTSTIGSSGGFFPKTALLAVLASKLYFILRFRAERKAIVLFLTVIFIIAKVIRYIKPGLFMIVFHCEQW